MLKFNLEGIKDDFYYGYNTTTSFLEDSLRREELIYDSKSTFNLTRATVLADNATPFEDLGSDIAWIYYRFRHPIKMHKWLEKLFNEQ